MRENDISRATLGRVPEYLRFLRELPAGTETISAPRPVPGPPPVPTPV